VDIAQANSNFTGVSPPCEVLQKVKMWFMFSSCLKLIFILFLSPPFCFFNYSTRCPWSRVSPVCIVQSFTLQIEHQLPLVIAIPGFRKGGWRSVAG